MDSWSLKTLEICLNRSGISLERVEPEGGKVEPTELNQIVRAGVRADVSMMWAGWMMHCSTPRAVIRLMRKAKPKSLQCIVDWAAILEQHVAAHQKAYDDNFFVVV